VLIVVITDNLYSISRDITCILANLELLMGSFLMALYNTQNLEHPRSSSSLSWRNANRLHTFHNYLSLCVCWTRKYLGMYITTAQELKKVGVALRVENCLGIFAFVTAMHANVESQNFIWLFVEERESLAAINNYIVLSVFKFAKGKRRPQALRRRKELRRGRYGCRTVRNSHDRPGCFLDVGL